MSSLEALLEDLWSYRLGMAWIDQLVPYPSMITAGTLQ